MPEPPQLTDIEMLGSIVHDLKNPIASIKSYADLVESSGELNERQQKYLSRIHTALNNMGTLVNDILDLVWIDSGMEIRKAPCNLLEVIRSQTAALDGFAKDRGVTITIRTGDDLSPVIVDERRIHQVVGNLLSNSIKYNREGGQIWITLTREDNELAVEIQDEGIGIAPEDLPHIFERFYRAQNGPARQIEGSGLGLAIAKAIIERHDGTLTVQSTPGQGSIFRFTLPIHTS